MAWTKVSQPGAGAWHRVWSQDGCLGHRQKLILDLQIASLNSFLCSLGLKIVYLPTRNKCDVIFLKVVRMTTDKRYSKHLMK